MRGSLELGAAIAESRTRQGLTQTDLAALLRLDQPIVSQIETGKRGVSVFELAEIADALGVTIGSLLPQEKAVFAMRAAGADSEELRLVQERCLEIMEDYLMLETATQ